MFLTQGLNCKVNPENEDIMKKIDLIAMVLLVIGGLNWGLLAVFDFNIVDYIFGRVWIDRVLYFFIGVSAVYAAFSWQSLKSRWAVKR